MCVCVCEGIRCGNGWAYFQLSTKHRISLRCSTSNAHSHAACPTSHCCTHTYIYMMTEIIQQTDKNEYNVSTNIIVFILWSNSVQATFFSRSSGVHQIHLVQTSLFWPLKFPSYANIIARAHCRDASLVGGRRQRERVSEWQRESCWITRPCACIKSQRWLVTTCTLDIAFKILDVQQNYE